MNNFELSRNWFNFSFENPDLIKPGHSAIYFFAIEHCNRLGGKEKFGFPTTMAMEAIGIKKYDTYIKCFTDLVDWGFIKLIEKSKNQYSSNVIALPEKGRALGKALDKAMVKHGVNHSESIRQSEVESKVSIDKQINKETIKQETIDEVYNKYPTTCPIKKRSTGKGAKDKEKIEKLLRVKSKEILIKIIETYVKDCTISGTYLKNFSTFLNNLPEYKEEVKPVLRNQDKTNEQLFGEL